MPRFSVTDSSTVATGDFPRIPGVTHSGAIHTKGVICAADQPMHMWLHELPPGAAIRFDSVPVSHGLFVWTGGLESEGKAVDTGGALVIEHRGSATIQASDKGATLAHFHRPEGHTEVPARAGGHVHVLGDKGIFHVDKRASGGSCVTLFADAGCPNCDVWLHRSYSNPNRELNTHCHSEDEIIFVTDGSMLLGRQELAPGTAIAIDRDTAYKFKAGPNGLSFVNYRSTEPFYIPVGPNGRGEPRNERLELRAMGDSKVLTPRN
ncbi:MAG: hypothetical protein EXR28_14680 [Betaproteobacteria bacterium]|nr:hypothetical protein [Betaproteobacteria bacterium]